MTRKTGSKTGRLIGTRLKQWRELTQTPLKSLAPELKASMTTVSHWERGIRFPTGQHIDLISDTTKIPVRCLFCSTPNCEEWIDAPRMS